MLPVVCVGVTNEERDSGGMWDKVSGQVCFAVLDRAPGTPTYRAFSDVLC